MVEIKVVKPSIFNGGTMGFKVLQYKTVMGKISLVGSRYFRDREDAEQYKKQIEENEYMNT